MPMPLKQNSQPTNQPATGVDPALILHSGISTPTLKVIRTLQGIAIQGIAQQGIAQQSSENRNSIWLVGGIVRDVLMGNSSTDVDIMCETDACTLAKEYHNLQLPHTKVHTKVRQYKKYRTASITYPDASTGTSGSSKLDISTPRREVFVVAGGKPEIEIVSTVEADLPRRDFNINAIAMTIPTPTLDAIIAIREGDANGSNFANDATPLSNTPRCPIIDPFGGRDAIESRTISVLHDNSFIDDPSRILRCLRFAARYGLTVDDHTLNLMHNAMGTRKKGGNAGAVASDAPLLANLQSNRVPYEVNNLIGEKCLPEIINLANRLQIDVFGAMFGITTPPNQLTQQILDADNSLMGHGSSQREGKGKATNTVSTANYALRLHTLWLNTPSNLRQALVDTALQGKPKWTYEGIMQYLKTLQQGGQI